jgi:hypothetical protein
MTAVKGFRVAQVGASDYQLDWLVHPDAIHYYIYYGQDIDMQGWYVKNSLGNNFNVSGAIRLLGSDVLRTLQFDNIAYYGGTDYYNDKINPGGILYFGIRAQNSNGELSPIVIAKYPDTL